MYPTLLLVLSAPTQERWVRLGNVEAFCLDPQVCQPSAHPDAMQGQALPLIDRRDGHMQVGIDTGSLSLRVWGPSEATVPVVRSPWTYSPRGPAGVTLLPGYGVPDPSADLQLRQELHATIPARALSQADIGQDFAIWAQPEVETALFELPPGATLLSRPRAGAAPLAVVDSTASVALLQERGPWSLVRWRGELVEITGWTQSQPTPLVPIAYGYCAGVHGFGTPDPPHELELPAQTSLYASAAHQLVVGQTTQDQRYVIYLDQDGSPFLSVSLPWGEAQAHLSAVADRGLESLRDWAGQGTLWVWRGQAPCLQATLTLDAGWFPKGQVVVEEPGSSPQERCTRSTDLSWVGVEGASYGGVFGVCELPDGSGSGWGGSEDWVDAFSPQPSGWALFAGEWMHPDKERCEQGLPQELEMVPLRGGPGLEQG